MSKLQTGTIQGYAQMTVEEKLAALEALEIPDPDYTGYVKKDVFDRTASELAAKKRELNEKLSADELKAKEDAEKQEKLQSDYDALLKKVTLSENKAQFLALGYDDALAEETAEAMADGNMRKVFDNQKKHQEAVEKKVREDVLNSTPPPDGGTGKKMSMDDIMKITDPVERQTAIAANIELFEKE